ncbi:MAG TPA: hypothetical protein VIY29_14000, partial [Ktedonobacteraceae bacterium]
GWIAVLRLAVLSLRSTSNTAAFMKRLRHYTDRSVSSYLVEEILAQQTLAAQEFLLRISILEKCSAELCAAVLGSEAPQVRVQAILDWSERSNVLFVSFSDSQRWYRFHHLFKRMFEQRLLARISKEEIATLHRRASVWFAEQGLIEEALEHALDAGDASGAAHLVEAHFLWAFEQEQWVQVERWLGLLPQDQIQGSPTLLVAQAWILQARGKLKDFPRVLMAAEQLLATTVSDADDTEHRLLHALIAIQRSFLQYFTGQAQASLEIARSALAWAPPGEEYVTCLACYWLALTNQLTGQEEVALAQLQQAQRDQSTHLNSTARLLIAQAWVYLAAGKLPQVEHTARHLLQIAQQADLVLSQHYAHWLLGVVYYERNNLDAAVYHFSAVIANQHLAHFWAVQEAMCGLALAYQAQGLATQTQESARVLLELVQAQNNMRDLMMAYAFRGRLALLQNIVEEASQWLELAGEQEIRGPMLFFEDPPITTAWMLLAKGDEVSVAHGQALLTQLLQYVEAIHCTRKTIQVLALQALAYDLQGRVTEALEVLERALALAYPGGFIRTFADLPKLSKVLGELRKRRKARQEVDKKLDAYLQRILAAMNPMATQAVSKEELMRQEGIEPL